MSPDRLEGILRLLVDLGRAIGSSDDLKAAIASEEKANALIAEILAAASLSEEAPPNLAEAFSVLRDRMAQGCVWSLEHIDGAGFVSSFAKDGVAVGIGTADTLTASVVAANESYFESMESPAPKEGETQP